MLYRIKEHASGGLPDGRHLGDETLWENEPNRNEKCIAKFEVALTTLLGGANYTLWCR